MPVPSATPSGTVYPVYGGSGDGRVTDRIDIQVGDDTPVLLDLSTLPRYVAQQGTVTATRLPSGVSGVTFSVDEQSVPGMLEVSDASPSSANVACTVKAMRAGSATVKVCDKATGDELGSFVLSVAAPVIKYEGNISDTHWLVPDGTARNLPAHYETTDRQVMTVAATDAEGFGLKFAPTLYASSLGDVAAVAGMHADAPLLGFDGRYVFLRYFQNAGRTAVFNTAMPDAVRLTSALCPDVAVVNLTAGIYPPVEGYLRDDLVVDDWTLLDRYRPDNSYPATLAWKTTSSAKILSPGGSITFEASVATKTKVAAANRKIFMQKASLGPETVYQGSPTVYDYVSFVETGNEGFSVRLTTEGTKRVAGSQKIWFVVSNIRSGQTYAQAIGRFDIYLHTWVGGFMKILDLVSGSFTGTAQVFCYPLGYSRLPDEFKNLLNSVIKFTSEMQNAINHAGDYYYTNNLYDGSSMHYYGNGPFNLTPTSHLYSMDYNNNSSNGERLKWKPKYYGVLSPAIEVDYDIIDYYNIRQRMPGKFYCRIGDERDSNDYGYYVFERFEDGCASFAGWFDFDMQDDHTQYGPEMQ